MMKKLLTVVLMGLILTSCSKEDVNQENPADFKLTIINNTDFSSQGTYKGVFAAFGSAKRGNVEITITDSAANASIQFEDGSELRLEGTSSFAASSVQSFRFVSELGSFDFTVNADGSNPEVSAVNIADAAGSIIIAKDIEATPIRTSTGTFGCDECGDHPILSDPNMQATFVWNIVFVGEGVEASTVLTQVTFGDRLIVSSGDLENPYNKVGSFVYNDMLGGFPFGEAGTLEWEATQMYNMEGTCVEITGTWNLSSPAYEISGWVDGDDSCNPL